MTPSDAYTRFVYRIWDRLTERTGSRVFYVDSRHIAAHCPACLDGTIRVGFVERPSPGFTIDSNCGTGQCSRGCTERAIAEALA